MGVVEAAAPNLYSDVLMRKLVPPRPAEQYEKDGSSCWDEWSWQDIYRDREDVLVTTSVEFTNARPQPAEGLPGWQTGYIAEYAPWSQPKEEWEDRWPLDLAVIEDTNSKPDAHQPPGQCYI